MESLIQAELSIVLLSLLRKTNIKRKNDTPPKTRNRKRKRQFLRGNMTEAESDNLRPHDLSLKNRQQCTNL